VGREDKSPLDDAGPITVAITDAKGNPVGMLSGRSDKAGEYVLMWDGRGQDGKPCPEGIYDYQVLGSFKPGTRGVVVIR
jgi:flagellar hook assembly protein FlgD